MIWGAGMSAKPVCARYLLALTNNLARKQPANPSNPNQPNRQEWVRYDMYTKPQRRQPVHYLAQYPFTVGVATKVSLSPSDCPDCPDCLLFLLPCLLPDGVGKDSIGTAVVPHHRRTLPRPTNEPHPTRPRRAHHTHLSPTRPAYPARAAPAAARAG
jgi:hypothetical protein